MSAETREKHDIVTFAVLASQAVTLLQKPNARTRRMIGKLIAALQMFKENVLGGVLTLEEFRLLMAGRLLAGIKSVEVLELSVKTNRQLERAGIKDVLSLLKLSEEELRRKQVSRTCIAELVQVFEFYGHYLHLGITELELERVRNHGISPGVEDVPYEKLGEGEEFIYENERYLVAMNSLGDLFSICLSGEHRASLVKLDFDTMVMKILR